MISLAISAAVTFVGFSFYSQYQQTEQFIGSAADNRNTVASTTLFTVGPLASVRLIPTSTSRLLVRVVSTSTSMFLSFSKPAVANGTASEVFANPFVLDFDHMYTGAIWAIASATGTISVTEFYNP